MLSVDHLNIDGPPLAVKCVRKFGSALGGEVMFVCLSRQQRGQSTPLDTLSKYPDWQSKQSGRWSRQQKVEHPGRQSSRWTNYHDTRQSGKTDKLSKNLEGCLFGLTSKSKYEVQIWMARYCLDDKHSFHFLTLLLHTTNPSCSPMVFSLPPPSQALKWRAVCALDMIILSLFVFIKIYFFLPHCSVYLRLPC